MAKRTNVRRTDPAPGRWSLRQTPLAGDIAPIVTDIVVTRKWSIDRASLGPTQRRVGPSRVTRHFLGHPVR